MRKPAVTFCRRFDGVVIAVTRSHPHDAAKQGTKIRNDCRLLPIHPHFGGSAGLGL